MPAPARSNASEPASDQAKPDLPKFDILEYEVEGNTVLSAMEIERAVYPHLGYGYTMNNVEAARLALERHYQESGYLTVSVDVPEQSIENGVVRLRVLEGKVGRVRVVGSRYYELGKIKEKVSELKPGTVPYFPKVQEQLAGLNRNQDRRVTPSLKPSRSPGKVDIDLKVDDHAPFHAGIELNNRYSANTKRLRLSGFVKYDNLFQRDHSFSLNYQTAPEKLSQVQVLSGTYLLPVGRKDSVLAVYGVHSNTDVAAIGTTGVVGKGNILGLRLIMPLRGWDGFYHSLTLGVDYKRFGETIKLLGNDALNRPISYVPFLVQYGATVKDSKGQTQYGISGNFALRSVFGNNDAEFNAKREGATANYFYLKADVSREQTLPKDWTLFAKFDLQWANSPLISNEQFGAGGADTVRGYLESERFGDVGYHSTIELRSPPLVGVVPEKYKAAVNEFYGLAFVDGAVLQVKDATAEQPSKFELLSAGLGVRLKAWKQVQVALDLAYPFKDGSNVKKGETRAHFSLGYEY